MRDFIEANPLVEVSIQELPAVDALAALRSGDIDLAGVVHFPELDLDDLERIVLRTEPAVLVLRQDDPLAGREAVKLSDLVGMAFVVTRPGTGLRRLFDHVFVAAEHRPHIAIETNELAAMVAFASAGLGYAILTPTVAREAVFPVGLVRLADVGPFTVEAVWSKDQHDPVVLSAIDMIRTHAA
jgi:DNA-binding transcriptional LysR family regulator